MSSLTALWRHIIQLIEARKSNFGTHWVQPENWVTRAIEEPVVASQVARSIDVQAPVTSSPATETPAARPGQAA